MARIRLLVPVAGIDFSWVPGDEIDLPDEEAAKWADGSRAEFVRPTKTRASRQTVELAVDAPAETR